MPAKVSGAEILILFRSFAHNFLRLKKPIRFNNADKEKDFIYCQRNVTIP